MKNRNVLALALSAVLLYLLAVAQHAAAGQLDIVIEEIAATEGHLRVQILQSEGAFRGEETAVAQMSTPALEGTVRLSVTLPPGQYGIRVLHDRNGNGELDTNMLGMPREPYGFSNNATGNFGPPVWRDLLFDVVNDPVLQRIALTP